jgi:lambda family phage portal protein
MNLTAPLRRAGLAVRQAWDMYWSGGPAGSSVGIWAWDASKSGSRLSKWWPPRTDFATILNPAILKARARDADRNNPWAHRCVNLLRDYVISTGVVPMVDTANTALRARTHSLWSAFCDSADFTGRFGFYLLQAEAFRSCLIDGEVLALIRPGRNLQVQILASEFLDYSRDNAQDIMGGIQYDADGKRLGYWLYQKHPAQPLNPVSEFVPADRVIHLYAPLQPGFERGVSWLAPALVPLYELQTYLEASLVRARTGSLFCGFIRSADGTPLLVTPDGDTNFEPGSMARLRPGDDVSFTTPPDPSQSFASFVATQLRGIASALSVPYELMSGDLSQITFASGRAGLLAFERHCDVLVQLFAYEFCRPIWGWWTRLMVASGELPEEILAAPVRWVGVPIPVLDSRQETQSMVQRIRAGLMSRNEAVRASGVDIESLDREIAADNARADELGLIFDSDARKVTLQGQEQAGVSFNGTPTQTIQ